MTEHQGRRLDAIVAATGLRGVVAEDFAKIFLAAAADLRGPSHSIGRRLGIDLDDLKQCFADAVGRATSRGDDVRSDDDDDDVDAAIRDETKIGISSPSRNMYR